MTIDIEGVYAKLPNAEKVLPCCIVDGKDYTWKEAIEIIRENKPIAKKIILEIESLEKRFK